ncbi:phosphoglycerate dehydrogenase [Pyruvatibacter sp.]|uniref:phosphoglycerate dehydrogenase n=1 Tax=Pyruvatibacter sp. TaxID=1981328 RepID=UPI0032665C0A
MSTSKATVLVTCPPMLGMIDNFRPRFAEAGIDLVAPNVVQIMTEDELCDFLPDMDGWIIGDDPATARVLEAGQVGKLRACVKWGVGVDNVDFNAAKNLGLEITNTPGVFGKEVADVAMNYVSGLARQTFMIDREIRTQNAWPKPSGISLAGKTVALVGLGDIGMETAKRLLAADMKVIAYDPFAKTPAGMSIQRAEWPSRVAEADFLVFTCPLTNDTRHMFNAELLNHLKAGVRVVNVSRGPVIDESALIKGLNDQTVHSAALDVFEIEPLPDNSPLRSFDRCIFGSHNGSNSSDAVARVSETAMDLLFGFLEIKG